MEYQNTNTDANSSLGKKSTMSSGLALSGGCQDQLRMNLNVCLYKYINLALTLANWTKFQLLCKTSFRMLPTVNFQSRVGAGMVAPFRVLT